MSGGKVLKSGMPSPRGEPCTVLKTQIEGNFVWMRRRRDPALLRVRVEERRDGRDGDDVSVDTEGVLARKVDLAQVSQTTTAVGEGMSLLLAECVLVKGQCASRLPYPQRGSRS